MKTELNVFFKMMQKDDKKEVLKFEIKGNEDGKAENDLFVLSGRIIVFNIEGCTAGEVTAEFMNIQRDSKKTVMKFAIKGDSEDKAQQLYKYAGRNVKLSVQPSQMSIEEFYEDQHEGLEYSVNSDGTVNVNSDQLSLDEVAVAADQQQDELPSEEPEKEDERTRPATRPPELLSTMLMSKRNGELSVNGWSVP
ncbi:hypothetical protein [Brevibacillus borstelensis]|uniref:hypothetical protein n=1 Tax=Brevibacillus borstelensis TaxID=45462 RepID=UPI0030BA6D35